MENRALLDKAIEIKKMAYAPYSNVTVGAALLTADDTLYTGVNIENASYGATNCAERTAIFKAVSDGHTKMKAIAIASNLKEFITPCGICRQVLVEFGTPDMTIILGDADDYVVYTLEELLPMSFTPVALKGEKHNV